MQSEFVKESIHIAQYVQENFANDANRLDRGVRQAGFLVLNATSMPSILVELGYISNAEEAKYLASASAQQRLSTCISKAFDKYYAELKRLNGGGKVLAEADPAVTEEKKIEMISTMVEDDTPVFKVQFLSSSKKLSNGDQVFKGLVSVEYYYDKGLYKYTCGASTNYNEILEIKRNVNEKFKDAFVVAFVKGERIDTQQAIAQFQKNNP
jgi:N-acetylmuramoyl-L-alanine amidase